jgi:putative sterol carrier protein
MSAYHFFSVVVSAGGHSIVHGLAGFQYGTKIFPRRRNPTAVNSIVFNTVLKSSRDATLLQLIPFIDFYTGTLKDLSGLERNMTAAAAPSLEEITTAMTEAVELDGTIKKKFNATVLFNVGGKRYTLHAATRPPADSEPVDLSVSLSLSTLQDLLQEKISAQKAFMQGLLKLEGKMSLAMKLNLVLTATRKHLAVQNARL